MRLFARYIHSVAVVLFFITFADSNAQIISERTLDRLDSLLAKENFAEINAFFTAQEARNQKLKLSDKGKSDFEMLKSSYLSTMKNIADSDKISAERAAMLNERIKANAKDFDVEVAGEQAAAYFAQFKTSLASSKRAEAFKNYYLARHFLAKHQRRFLQEITTALAESEEKLGRREYEVSLLLMREIESKAQARFVPNEYRDGINRHKTKAKEGLASLRLEKILYGQTDTPKYSWAVALGGQVANNMGIRDVNWKITALSPIYRDSLYSYDRVFDVPQELGAGYSVAVSGALFRKLQIEVQAAHSSFHYQAAQSSGRQRIGQTEYKINYAVVHLNLNYFLRAQIGIRYCAGFGFGYARASRPQIEKTRGIYDCCNPERLRAEQINTVVLNPNVGVEFVPTSLSRVSYRASLGANYNFASSQLLSRVTLYSNILAAFRF